jgi:N-formylglutamate deformylase
VHKLPLLVSVPHAGLAIPPEVAALNRLTAQEIAEDGDVGAREIYGVLEPYVAAFVISDIARAFVDLNRAEDDIRKDGVIKTHTCWDVPVYERPLGPPLIEALLARYHRPYHERLRALGTAGVIAGVDCHTMAAVAPPEAPDPGQPRPNVCVGDGNGACPRPWAEALAERLRERFPGEVTINEPFAGGYITRHHGRALPWVQLELSRADFASATAKGRWVREALAEWVEGISG